MGDQNRPQPDDDSIEVTVRLKPETLLMVERCRREFGLSTRGEVVSRILDELLLPADSAVIRE